MAHVSPEDRGPLPPVCRHRLSTRLWHWTNAVALVVLLMSGLTIFNAHPRLYWGQYGANPDPAWLEFTTEFSAEAEHAFLHVAGAKIETTGVLGARRDAEGRLLTTAFPGWATIPSTYDLAVARRWHLTVGWLFGAMLVGYLAWSTVNGHLGRDLLRGRVKPSCGIVCRYNLGQRALYLLVMLVLLPLVLLTGLTMSPAMVASWPWLLDVFGGRQSARTLHFLLSVALVVFVLVHIATLLVKQPLNRLRAMVTGLFREPKESRG